MANHSGPVRLFVYIRAVKAKRRSSLTKVVKRIIAEVHFQNIDAERIGVAPAAVAHAPYTGLGPANIIANTIGLCAPGIVAAWFAIEEGPDFSIMMLLAAAYGVHIARVEVKVGLDFGTA